MSDKRVFVNEAAKKEPEKESDVAAQMAAEMNQAALEAEIGDGEVSEDSDAADDEELLMTEKKLATKDDGLDDDGVFQVDFDYYDPRPDDWYTLAQFLRNLCDDDELDSTQLAHLVSNQVSVGTMIKNGPWEEQPLCFATALNPFAPQHRERRSIRHVIQWLRNKAKAAKETALLELLDEAEQGKLCVGLLLQHRLINLPPGLIPALHNSLLEDVQFARTNKEDTAEERASFNFDKYIVMSRVFREIKNTDDDEGEEDEKSGPPAKRRKKQEHDEVQFVSDEDVHYMFEEECFVRNAETSVRFAVPRTHAQKGVREWRVISVLRAEQMPRAVADMWNLIDADVRQQTLAHMQDTTGDDSADPAATTQTQTQTQAQGESVEIGNKRPRQE
ncbi:MAG: hypothetical protein MHM6MM_004251 [Cercozoa sp. M6MM]